MPTQRPISQIVAETTNMHVYSHYAACGAVALLLDAKADALKVRNGVEMKECQRVRALAGKYREASSAAIKGSWWLTFDHVKELANELGLVSGNTD